VTLARHLKAARHARFGDLSIETFAARAGISPSTLRKLERGVGNPGFFTVAGVASELGLSLDDLARSS
jgi:transcriptional regulator with XRE-family HTH domain